MSRIEFKLWIDSDVIGTWTDPHLARHAAAEYIAEHPNDYQTLRLTGFVKTHNGLKPVFSYIGDEIQTYLDEMAEDDDS